MSRMPIYNVSKALLHDLAAVDDVYSIAHVMDYGEIVRHEQVAQTEPALNIEEKVEDLCLNREVEGTDRFIANYEPRGDHERSGNRNSLSLATRELPGVTFRGTGRQSNELQHLTYARICLRTAQLLVDSKRLDQRFPDWLRRVERAIWVLEDHLHISGQVAPCCARKAGDLLAAEIDAPARHGYQPEDGVAYRRLPGS